MQFVKDGPDIPLELLDAHEDGRLVLFCGAGVSMCAGLPSFEGLVERVYSNLGTVPDALENQDYLVRNFDRVLGLLEREERFAPSQVRHEVSRILAVPSNPHLAAHKSIIDLCRDRKNRLRLVTTNFDWLFETAEPAIPVCSAPALPVPKRSKWDALVHLHGRLDSQNPHGDNIVLSSADFGVAYLIERWASKFVSELFANFAVLFVGYSVDDPILRYVIDAIAAERRRGQGYAQAYALTVEKGPGNSNERWWLAKNVTPIQYPVDPDGTHSRLYKTLEAWATAWRGGIDSKLNIVQDIGVKRPATIPPEDISRFCWALQDPSGAPAARLALLGADVGFDWLSVLEMSGLVNNVVQEVGAEKVSLVSGMPSPAIVSMQLKKSHFGVARWVATHAADPELVRWVVSKGGHIHPVLVNLVMRALDENPSITPPLKQVWSALCGGVELHSPLGNVDYYALVEKVTNECWSPAMRLDVLRAFTPCVRISPARNTLSALEGTSAARELSIADLLSFECEVRSGTAAEPLLNQLCSRSDSQMVLADLTFEATGLLKRSLDLMACLGGASSDHDPSYMDQPSIERHEQNHHVHGWTLIIELVRYSFEALVGVSPSSAQGLVRTWTAMRYPTFRRLVMFAVGKHPC